MSGGSNINLDGFLDIASLEDQPQDPSIPDRNGDPPKNKRKKIMHTQREFVLKDWLASLSLGEYYNVLYKEGYDKPLSLKVLTDEELIELGIKKKGHRIILLNAIKDEYFTSLTNPAYYYASTQYAQPQYRLTNAPHQPHYEPPTTYQQPIYHPNYQPVAQQPIHQQPPNQAQRARASPGQLVPMGFVHSDSPSSDSEMEETSESTNGLFNSSDIPVEQHAPQSPTVSYKSAPLRNSQPQAQPSLNYQSPPPPRPLSPPQRQPQRYHDEYDDQDEDEDDASTLPLPTPSQPSHAHQPVKIRINTKDPPTHSPTSKSALSQPEKTAQTNTTTTTSTSTAPEPQKAPKKRSRSSDKPEQANQDPDAPPKPKPAAITFIPKQHYSRSDIHDCLGGQRFCAISTPSAYPFILIFAHYQAYVGEDGMWEHIASGDLNKGVNRGVIHAKDKKKRLLLFFSTAGQQGAVLFLGEVKYVSSEQREEKNSKGVDKACVVFKFQRINNDAITINLFDFTKPEVMTAQPKPVIRSLTENPNTYYLDSAYGSSNFTEPSNNINPARRRSLVSSSSIDSSSDAIAIIPIASPPSSPALSSTSSTSPSPPSHSLLPIKKERKEKEGGGGEEKKEKEGGGTEEVHHVPTTTITSLSRTSISKVSHEGRGEPLLSSPPSSLPNITRLSAGEKSEKGERKEREKEEKEEGWAHLTNGAPITPTASIIPISDTRGIEKQDNNNSTNEKTNNTTNASHNILHNNDQNNNNNTTNNNLHESNFESNERETKDDFVVPSDGVHGSPSSLLSEPSAN